ncbi:MAG: paraquat-inducible protein A, partial [Janthinobacterium lividum]
MPNVQTSPEAHEGHLRECLACGLFQQVPPVGPKQAAHCLRCDAPLRRGRKNPLTYSLAFTLAAALMLALAATLPFLGLRAIGRFYPSTMLTGPVELSRHGLPELGLLVVMCAIVMPAIKLALMAYVLVGLRTANPPASLPRAFAWLDSVRPWAMVEVFMLGVFVAFSRLEA